jgi:hypothetical protein
MQVLVEVSHTVKVVRQRSFTARDLQDVRAILEQLAKERHTGPVRINMAQGGIRSMDAEDAQALSA